MSCTRYAPPQGTLADGDHPGSGKEWERLPGRRTQAQSVGQGDNHRGSSPCRRKGPDLHLRPETSALPRAAKRVAKAGRGDLTAFTLPPRGCEHHSMDVTVSATASGPPRSRRRPRARHAQSRRSRLCRAQELEEVDQTPAHGAGPTGLCEPDLVDAFTGRRCPTVTAASPGPPLLYGQARRRRRRAIRSTVVPAFVLGQVTVPRGRQGPFWVAAHLVREEAGERGLPLLPHAQ